MVLRFTQKGKARERGIAAYWSEINRPPNDFQPEKDGARTLTK